MDAIRLLSSVQLTPQQIKRGSRGKLRVRWEYYPPEKTWEKIFPRKKSWSVETLKGQVMFKSEQDVIRLDYKRIKAPGGAISFAPMLGKIVIYQKVITIERPRDFIEPIIRGHEKPQK